MAKDKHRRGSMVAVDRDSGGFVALPWAVLDSSRYKSLSHTAKSLLLEFARQSIRDNNGRLLASSKYLSKRGWKSASVIHRAKNELLEKGFIYETVKGHRPNKASWYAVTWLGMSKHPGFDAGAMEGWRDARSAYAKPLIYKNNLITPAKRIGDSLIDPSKGATALLTTPSKGAIRGQFAPHPIPPEGNHLDMPSTAH